MAENGKTKTIHLHLLAIIIVIVWGTTFVSTKTLILCGLTPAVIFALRFAIAYLLLLVCLPKPLFCRSVKDELLMLLLGVSGGSLYFLTENMALVHTTATNTSMIVCSCPLFAALLYCGFMHFRMSRKQWTGTVVALLGMVTVVLNGRFVLHLSPIGDILAFTACLCWALYSILIKTVSDSYSSLFINRKVFFYGVLTIIPYLAMHTEELPCWQRLMQPTVIGNILFLSLIASLACYVLWTMCIKRLGAVNVTNYVYLNPLATIVAATIILNEQITIWFLLGTALILAGLYLCEKNEATAAMEKQ